MAGSLRAEVYPPGQVLGQRLNKRSESQASIVDRRALQKGPSSRLIAGSLCGACHESLPFLRRAEVANRPPAP